MLCPRALKHAIKYMTASMVPQARLQPSASTSKFRTCAWPEPATLNEQVTVITMMSPKRTSKILSKGSRTRLRTFSGFSGIGVLKDHTRIQLKVAVPQGRTLK